ncbi:MAG: RidA family protein [Marinicaulis sp.]|nr:RidA family protein [Marinicaulis sp.]NNL88184.1 RidA family protein [Marinicaulis sp.]
MSPIGPYSHIAKSGNFISISATAGVDPTTQKLAGLDIKSQTRQIIHSFEKMLNSVNSDFAHILHVNIFLKDMKDYAAMNDAYGAAMGAYRPARTVVGVASLPKTGALVTMNLTAVEKD